MKVLILVIALLAPKTLAFTKKRVEPTPTPVVASTPIVAASPGEISFQAVEYYTTKAERELIAKAAAKANEIKKTDCYYNFIANRKMIQTQGKPTKQIADEIRALTGVVPVKFYYAFNSASAYRSPPSMTINLNRRWIGSNSDVCDVAGTLLHESLHALKDFEHDFYWSASREFSVPYSSDHAFAKEPYSQSDSGGCCK